MCKMYIIMKLHKNKKIMQILFFKGTFLKIKQDFSQKKLFRVASELVRKKQQNMKIVFSISSRLKYICASPIF